MKQSLVAAAAICTASVAFGQTVDLKITGSTAFRSVAYSAIRNLYGAGLATQNPAHNASGANTVTFQGTMPLFGTRTVIIRTAYTGSVEGVRDLTQNANITFLSSATPGVSTTLTTTADFAFSDVFQATTDYQSPVLDDQKAGVVAFAWTRSVNCPVGFANMTHQQAQLLLANGTLPLSFFTGNLADTQSLYLVGRSVGSGTRAVTQADCGYGATASSSLFKFASGAWTDDAVGFSSGSGIATLLKDATANSAANGYSVGYLGIADSDTVNSGLNRVTFNGVAFSKDAVRRGQYSFWGPEHLFTKVSPSADATTFKGSVDPSTGAGTGLLKAIDDFLGDPVNNSPFIQSRTMLVDRQADGGPIAP